MLLFENFKPLHNGNGGGDGSFALFFRSFIKMKTLSSLSDDLH